MMKRNQSVEPPLDSDDEGGSWTMACGDGGIKGRKLHFEKEETKPSQFGKAQQRL